MGLVDLIVIAIGLAMDAFAVSLAKGLGMRELSIRHMLIIALFFGGFQALMPLIGWVLGSQFEVYIAPIDHWVAFFLLALVGGKMIYDALKGEAEPKADPRAIDALDYRELLVLAVATSIDALAVGITFSFLQVRIVPAICIIGTVTFVLSVAGVLIGHRFGARFEKQSGIFGGIILILIGLRILLEHLGVISF